MISSSCSAASGQTDHSQPTELGLSLRLIITHICSRGPAEDRPMSGAEGLREASSGGVRLAQPGADSGQRRGCRTTYMKRGCRHAICQVG